MGAKFAGFESLSINLVLGMFIAGIPEAAASATTLRRAGYSNRAIVLTWSAVLPTGGVAAVGGRLFISGEGSAAVFAQAIAGGAILALVCATR